MEQVWAGIFVNSETVTQRAKLLRDALGDDPKCPRYFTVRRGSGYQLVPKPARLSSRIGPTRFNSEIDERLENCARRYHIGPGSGRQPDSRDVMAKCQ